MSAGHPRVDWIAAALACSFRAAGRLSAGGGSMLFPASLSAHLNTGRLGFVPRDKETLSLSRYSARTVPYQ